ncbi:hypothetical protein C8J56DRAFT_940472 [Mycena floridula]|nr:hypothetical protein C8J56DRAFT_940472 [Mycena floridula]
MPVLSLPLTFANSFWSQEYRRGLEVLYRKLEQGVAENEEITAFIRSRAFAEQTLANSLANAHTRPHNESTGFGADDGASLLMAFRGLQGESVMQAQAHRNIANELTQLVVEPFEEWAGGYRDRLKQSKLGLLDNWLRSYEHSLAEVARLKKEYLGKVRRADEAEDDAKFAPSGNAQDPYTTSPRMRPADGRASPQRTVRTPPQRTASVSERIAQRLREIQRKSAGNKGGEKGHGEDGEHDEKQEKRDEKQGVQSVEKSEKDVEKGVESLEQVSITDSPPPMEPPLPPAKIESQESGFVNSGSSRPASSDVLRPAASEVLRPASSDVLKLAGIPFTPSSLSQLLLRASHELPLRAVRFPLLGQYEGCFSGEEFVAWMNLNVPAFNGSLDRAEDAAKDLTEHLGLLRRIGELGNQFECSDDAFYQFRAKAFDLASHPPVDAPNTALKSAPENILKKTGNFYSLVTRALANTNSEPQYVRLRQEAEDADWVYRVAVRKLDRQRLGLEEKIEDTLKTLQHWEGERLRAVKSVLLQFQGTISNIPKSLEPSMERSTTLIAAYQPEADLGALVERYRVGPFRPTAQVYESVAHDEADVLFGIDLRKGDWGDEKVPPVLTALIKGVGKAYERVSSDMEKRKSWIYDVPLPAVHHLREALNAIPTENASGDAVPVAIFFEQAEQVLSKYDAPVIASCIRLWLLELDPPVVLWEGWDEVRRLYKANSGDKGPVEGKGKAPEKTSDSALEQRLTDLGSTLQKLPRVHLYVLDAVVAHLRGLVDSTKVEEDDEVYMTKVALSLGRAIVRPKTETEISIQDRHPTRELFWFLWRSLLLDLLTHYPTILPPTIARKKRESERKLRRSRMPEQADKRQLLAMQHDAQRGGVKSPEIPYRGLAEPPVPPLPPTLPPSVPSVPSVPPPPPLEKKEKEKEKEKEELVVPPPPPPPSFVSTGGGDETARPTFVEPPPELDDDAALPTPKFAAVPSSFGEAARASFGDRPSFKEPPPELDDDLPPRPSFKEPPPEMDDEDVQAAVATPVPAPAATTAPVTTAVAAPVAPPPSSSPDLTRRGPRITRGPRAPGTGGRRGGSGSGSPIIRNRDSLTGSTSPTKRSIGSSSPRSQSPANSQSPTSPTYQSSSGPAYQSSSSPAYKRLSGGPGSPGRRPSSVLGRSSAFSRRTMASDAEDDVVDKK